MKEILVNYVITNPIFWIVVIVIGLLIIFKKEIKISTEDYWVRKSLNSLGKDYTILTDVKVKLKNKDVKMDYVIVSKYGIFVVQIEKESGKIYGNDSGTQWIEIDNKEKKYFDNPVKKINTSINVLSSILDLDNSYFISIISFPSKAVLDVETKSIITNAEFLDDNIKSYKKEVIKYGLNEIKDKIKNTSYIDNVKVKSSNNVIKEKTSVVNKTNKSICPKCGGKLIKRNGKYGEFYGCSNYPLCDFTKEV